MNTRNAMTRSSRVALLALFFFTLSFLSGDQVNTQAQQDDIPQGFIGAQVNGKDCEILLRQDGETLTYALNPDLSPDEGDLCKRMIKDISVRETRESEAQQFVPGEFIVGFHKRQNNLMKAQELIESSLADLTFQDVSVRPAWAKIRLALAEGLTVERRVRQTEEAIQIALESGAFSWVEPNYLGRAMEESWGLDAIGAPLAQSAVDCDEAIGIAIVDTGVSLHNELPNVVHLYDYVNEDDDASDDNGHGTFVASVAGGLSVGVCPGASIYAVKVLDEYGYGTYDQIAQGIVRAAEENAVHVINISIGGVNDSQVLEQAISLASDAGKLVFMSSGNSLGEEPEYPAYFAKDYTNTLAVGAIDKDYRLAIFSSRFGPVTRAAVAPGVDVVGADYTDPSSYLEANGTSASSPFWAGSAALVWSVDTQMTSSEVMTSLVSNTVSFGDEHEYGMGMLNVSAAVKEVAGAGYNIPPIAAWPLPWPASVEVGERMEIVSLLHDIDGDDLIASATITGPGGDMHSIPLTPEADGLWTGEFTPSDEGEFEFVVSVDDGLSASLSSSVSFYVVRAGHVWGWTQHGASATEGSFVPYKVMLSSHEQVYAEGDAIAAGNDQSVVGKNYRADIPEAVRIIGACVLGDNYGSRWFFNPFIGLQHSIDSGEAVQLSCYEGIGMFAEVAATNGTFFTYDEGTSGSPPARLQSFDPWGRLFWLTQLGEHSEGPVRLSGNSLYVVGGIYDGLNKIDARTGQREWFFRPGQSTSIYVPPVIAEERNFVIVKVSGNPGSVYAIRPGDGSVVWQYSISGSLSNKSELVLSRDTLIVCNNYSVLHALSISEIGAVPLWSQTIGDSNCDSTPAVLGEDYVVAYGQTSGGNNLHVLSMENGDILASIEVVDFGSARASPIVVGKDFVFLADYDGYMRGYRIRYTDGVPVDLERVWEDVIDPYTLSNWQLSAFVENIDGEMYLTIPVSSNNGFLEGHRFLITGHYGKYELFLPITKGQE